MKKLPLLVALLVSFGCATHQGMQPHYHVARHIPIGGEGGWDALTIDSASQRLFVSHADRVNVVDLVKGTVVGTILKTEGVHAIDIAPALRRGFITAGRTSTVTVFDLDSLATIGEIKTTGDRPDAIIFDPGTSRVFTFNAAGKNSTVIDAKTATVVGTIELGGKPEFAVSDGKGRVFVNIEDTSELVAIDPAAMTVVKRWSLAPCTEPSGLAIDRAHRRLFSGCDNRVMAISDADSGSVITTVPIGDGVDGGGFDPASGDAFASNGADGTLTVVHETGPMKFDVIGNVPTQRGARTMAVDERTHHIYLPTAQFGPPPAPTAERPKPRPSILAGTFEILDVAP
ncbi:MAG TPA: YncE family protein [Thermoanaerobaculia bacterium]|nr:YncE family protein [Thermoanaerobaculia bacterium]